MSFIKVILLALLLLFLVGLGVVGIMLRGLLGVAVWLRRAAGMERKPAGNHGFHVGEAERMVACTVCGVHVPESEGIRVAGEFFCCDAHRHARGDTNRQ